MTTEQIIVAWLEALVAAAEAGTALHGAQVCKTVYGGVVKDRCVQAGPVTGATPRPSAGGEEVEEFDAAIVIVLLRKVGAALDDAAYHAAIVEVVEMGLAVAKAAFDDNTLGFAARDSMPDELPRDFTTIAKEPYAVANLKLLLNPSGD